MEVYGFLLQTAFVLWAAVKLCQATRSMSIQLPLPLPGSFLQVQVVVEPPMEMSKTQLDAYQCGAIVGYLL